MAFLLAAPAAFAARDILPAGITFHGQQCAFAGTAHIVTTGITFPRPDSSAPSRGRRTFFVRGDDKHSPPSRELAAIAATSAREYPASEIPYVKLRP